LLSGSAQLGNVPGPKQSLAGLLAGWKTAQDWGRFAAGRGADRCPNGVGRSPRRLVPQRAIVVAGAAAVSVPVKVRIPVSPHLALPLAHLAAAGWALGDLR
jgi:hypothetical protein